MRLGVTFSPDLPPERLQSVARAADAAGLDELWLWEDCFRESGIATAAAALAWTERITVGIGLSPAPLRNVALMAMEAATLARLFPGRFVLGVGHGVQDWMAQVGARVGSPVTLLREYVHALTRLLNGHEVSVDGRYVKLDRVRLDWPPEVPPAVVAGASGPKSLVLCAQIAAGTLVTSGRSVEEVAGIRALLDHARRDAGVPGAHDVIATVTVATGDGARERLHRALAAWGQPADDRLGVHGDARAVADGIRRYAEAGADAVIVLKAANEPDLEGLIRFLGHGVRPLL